MDYVNPDSIETKVGESQRLQPAGQIYFDGILTPLRLGSIDHSLSARCYLSMEVTAKTCNGN